MKFRSRLILGYTLLAIVASFLIGGFYNYYLKQRYQSNIYNNARITSTQVLNNLEDDYATSYGTEFTMSVENMVRFCNSVYQMYLFFEEDEGVDSVKTLEFNDEYDGSDNIIRIYYCEKDSYMFIQCYYKDPSGNKVDMWEVGMLDRNNIVDFIVTLLKFAEDIMEK